MKVFFSTHYKSRNGYIPGSILRCFVYEATAEETKAIEDTVRRDKNHIDLRIDHPDGHHYLGMSIDGYDDSDQVFGPLLTQAVGDYEVLEQPPDPPYNPIPCEYCEAPDYLECGCDPYDN